MSAYPSFFARHWLLTLLGSALAVFAASYFYFTTIHALESFDTASCTPLAAGSSGKCVSSLQALLNRNEPYPAIAVDRYFGPDTQQAVEDFQSTYHLTVDGDVASQTAAAINRVSPRPGILSYAAGFASSRLTAVAKLCVVSLLLAVTIICILLRAARAGSSRLLRIRCALAGLFAALAAASSAATATLMNQAHGWVTKFLCVILIALTATLIKLLKETFPSISGFASFADPPSHDAQPPIGAGYGS